MVRTLHQGRLLINSLSKEKGETIVEEYMNEVKAIIATLEGVKADGPDNWNRLLACDQALRDMLAQMQAEKQEEHK